MNYDKMLFIQTPSTKMSQNTCLTSLPQPPASSQSSLLSPQSITTETAAAAASSTQSPSITITTTTTTVASKTTTLPSTNAFLQPSTDPYSMYADNFDLSLLPQDCASSTENIPTIVFQYTNDTSTTTTTPTPHIKIEQTWHTSFMPETIKQEPHANTVYYEELNKQQQQLLSLKSPIQLIPPPPYPHIYPTPQSSPAQSEYAFPSAQFAGCYDSLSSSRSSLYPSSPCPSLDANSIKQELHILPPSPPESNCETPSPQSACAEIKLEPIDADVETLIDLNILLEKQQKQQQQQQQQQQQHQQGKLSSSASALESSSVSIVHDQHDHQVLREYLEDTTFQKRHNLKPLALESFIGGLQEVRGDIEPVISLALEHAKREADETCAKLQISQDPSAWSPVQVHAWLRSTIAQFKLPQIDNLDTKFHEDGATLILLSEEEFLQRSPESGSTLHAQLEIWKMAFADGYHQLSNINTTVASAAAALTEQQQEQSTNNNCATPTIISTAIWNGDCMQIDEEEDSEDEENISLPPIQSNNNIATTVTNVNTVPSAVAAATETAVEAASTATAVITTNDTKRPVNATGGRNGGSHIHLWQFLKELLSTPNINGTAIRWIDRSKGIFKIEDSVRVAKLWGRRKNRPAMNYDKLSRSIRQYYKKGIMKKTERSQRLVYQFCHPYHM